MCLVYPSAVCRPPSYLNVSVERSWRLHHHCGRHTGMTHLVTADTAPSNTQDLAVTRLFWTHHHSTNIHFKSIHILAVAQRVECWTSDQQVVRSNTTRGKSYVTTVGKLFTHMCLCTMQYNLVPAKGRWCSVAGKVTAGLAESNGSLPLGGWLTVSCGLTAYTPGSAPCPMLSDDIGKPSPFYHILFTWTTQGPTYIHFNGYFQ